MELKGNFATAFTISGLQVFCSSALTPAEELGDFPVPSGLFPLKPRLSDHSQREPRPQSAPIPALLHAASS